jgi:DNA repair protein RecO (recombination protein O)
MALVRCEGIVLKTHALGDTSLIVVTYTREHGLLRLVAKAARRTPSRFGFALEPLSRSRFVVYHKADRDLQLVSQAEVLDPIGSRLFDLSRLAHAQAALELIDRLVWGEEAHAELFDLLGAVLTGIATAPPSTLPAVTLAYQLQVASLLGYRPRLDGCPGCGSAISPRRLFSAVRGGLLCERCASTEVGTITLSADALCGLALLLSRPVSQAGEWLALVEVRRTGEILRVVEAFLRQHFQRFHGLRSLEVLRSLPGFENSQSGAPNGAPVEKDDPCPN